jgi:hypothetical protein
MLYAQVSDDGSVVKWPVSEAALRAALPHVSFPRPIQEEHLIGTGFVMVPTVSREHIPQETADLMIQANPVLGADGKYQRVYTLVPVPEVIREQRIARQWKRVRARRDQLMAEMAWRQARHWREIRLKLTPTEDGEKLDRYMQALADVPQTNTDPFQVQWPEVI